MQDPPATWGSCPVRCMQNQRFDSKRIAAPGAEYCLFSSGSRRFDAIILETSQRVGSINHFERRIFRSAIIKVQPDRDHASAQPLRWLNMRNFSFSRPAIKARENALGFQRQHPVLVPANGPIRLR